jgi:hypothetical protein
LGLGDLIYRRAHEMQKQSLHLTQSEKPMSREDRPTYQRVWREDRSPGRSGEFSVAVSLQVVRVAPADYDSRERTEHCRRSHGGQSSRCSADGGNREEEYNETERLKIQRKYPTDGRPPRRIAAINDSSSHDEPRGG